MEFQDVDACLFLYYIPDNITTLNKKHPAYHFVSKMILVGLG